MKNIYTKVCVLLFVLTSYLAPNNQLMAQYANFTMSSVGQFPNMYSVGAAFEFRSNNSCIDVQTGVAVLEGERGNGTFNVNCSMAANINTLAINLFPNPVSNIARIKFLNTPPLTENFNVTVLNAAGLVVNSRKETGFDLFQGIAIDMSRLSSGSYSVKIESPNYIDAIKFVKAN